VFATAATRPRYGGTLRVEIREEIETLDPPSIGPGIAELTGDFSITLWEAGHRAAYTANENAPGGRPFLDGVEITMGRSLREQALDLDLGKADVVEIGPGEARRQTSGRRVWSSAPVRVLAVVFGPRVDDPRIREALALAVDRNAIHNVLLQRQGEISGALLPQWISGYAFLFPASADIGKARGLVAAAPAGARGFTLAVEDTVLRPIADRIALNARDAGLAVTVRAGAVSGADARLLALRVASAEPARAMAGMAVALGAQPPPRLATAEDLFQAERALLEGFRVVPLFHLPEMNAVNPRVKGAGGLSPLGEWRFQNLWVESGRP
jgi:ABC-type transport system substrate-binding protein